MLLKKCFCKEAFLSTVCQYILFKFVFSIYTQIYIISHSYTTTVNDAVILYIIIPIISGVLCYIIISIRCFKIQKRTVKSKAYKQKFACRMLAIACFILIGYGLEILHVKNPEFSVRLLEIAGINNNYVFDFVFRFSTYILVAIFPISYALTEFLFSSGVRKHNIT